MKFWSSVYQLYPKGSVQPTKNRRFRKGAILRVQFEDGLVGFGDLCPFSECGDAPIERELQNLQRQKKSRIAERTIYLARQDAEARKSKTSIFNEVRIRNHFLVHDLLNFDLNRIPPLQGSRFTEFKIKIGQELTLETEMLKEFVGRLAVDSKVRLDFNSSMSRDRFVDWLEKNLNWLNSKIDFIEDPFSYEPRDWARVQEVYNIRLALDLAADPLTTNAEGASVVIIKPAIQDDQKVLAKLSDPNLRFVYTHYLDFPIGQMGAYFCAQRAIAGGESRILTCGLQHHDVYEGFTFQDAVKNAGPFLAPPEGHGVGFDDLIAKLDWIEIS